MTHRIETQRGLAEAVVVFTGVLDDRSFTDLAGQLASAGAARLVLATGTQVTQGAMARLRELRVVVRAESPFLEAWLRSTAQLDGEGYSPEPTLPLTKVEG